MDPVGKIEVVFLENGDMKFDINGKVSYIQIYGVAATLHEIARVQHVQQHMAQMTQGIEVARGMPGGIQS